MLGPPYILALCLCFALVTNGFAQQGWGNIKGKVEWTPAVIPAPENLVDGVPPANIPPCVKGGVLPSDELLIDKGTKGVANTLIWLGSLKDRESAGRKPALIPIHPDRKALPKEAVIIDQPCCLFEPRVLVVREGQKLEVRNSAGFPHSFKFDGDSQINGGKNVSIPPGGKQEFSLKAEKKKIPITCALHGWMKGTMLVLDHPYFAISQKDGTFEIKDAPAGKFVLFVYHEKAGWLHKPDDPKKLSAGQTIEIKPGETLDLGKLAAK
jgi:hypothetical protein